MRYSLLSHGRLLGYTDLDIATVSPNLREGFIEPSETGHPLLRDATGVLRLIGAESRSLRANARERDEHLDRFLAACERREALDLELRDENGHLFECDYMRVYDLRELEQHRPVDDDDDVEHTEYLMSLTPEERASEEEERQSMAAMLDEWVAEWMAERNDEEMYHSAWPPPPPPDARWETMRYHVQVILKPSPSPEWDEE